MNHQEHINNSLARIRVFFEEAAAHIEGMQSGEKIAATELSNRIAEKHDLSNAALYPVMRFLFEGYPGVEVKKGAVGGIYKLEPNNASS